MSRFNVSSVRVGAYGSFMKRRQFVQVSSMALGAGVFSGRAMAAEASAKPLLTLGLLTHVHYADKESKGSRFYRDSLAKGREAAAFFKERKPAAVICLGDVIDAAKTVEEEVSYLKAGEEEICTAMGPRRKELGLIFVGIDVIGGEWLTEINVTSPTGIVAIDRFNGTDTAAKIWDACAGRFG